MPFSQLSQLPPCPVDNRSDGPSAQDSNLSDGREGREHSGGGIHQGQETGRSGVQVTVHPEQKALLGSLCLGSPLPVHLNRASLSSRFSLRS